jgi:hypothetical protein
VVHHSTAQADFTSQLAFKLARPLAFFGQMGGTQHVPRLYEDMIRQTGIAPDVVVWVAINGGWRDLRPIKDPKSQDGGYPFKDRLVGRFRVDKISPPPKPGDGPYPDALYTFKVQAMSDRGPKEALVITWAFRDRQETAQRRVNVGKTLDLELAAWEETCETQPNLRRLQRVDTLNEYALPMFFWDQPN